MGKPKLMCVWKSKPFGFRNRKWVSFQKERSVITKHINNIFNEGELQEDMVLSKENLKSKI
jgi:hypothetical protein